MFAVAQLAARAAGQSAPSWRDLGRVNFLPELGFTAWWLWLATNGLGEETGWRGFALPRLQQHHSPIISSAAYRRLGGLASARILLPAELRGDGPSGAWSSPPCGMRRSIS